MKRWTAVPDPPKPPRFWTFLSAALAVPLIFAALALWLGAEDQRSEGMRRDLQRSFASNIEMVRTLALLADAETSQRGYLLTGDPAFLDLYAPAKRDVLAQVVDLRRRFDGDPAQQRRLATFDALARAKFAEMDRVLASRQTDGLTTTARRVSEGGGKRIMDEARAVAGEIITVEDAATARRRTAFEAGTANNRRIAWGIVIAAAVLIAIAMFTAWRQRRERFVAAEAGYIAAQRQRIIFDSTVDAIAILNPSGSIETINAAAEAMLGYRAEELDRRDFSVLVDLPHAAGTFHERIGLIGGKFERPLLTDRVARRRDGGRVPVDVALGVMRLPGEDYVIASMRDISERKRVEQMKDDLISTVSHELRTPLTSIVGALGLLQTSAGGSLPPSTARLIEIAENNSARLIRLINDMLDMDRIDAGKLHVETRRIDLSEVVRRSCTSSSTLRERDVRVSCRGLDAARFVNGDADRLTQVIANLVSNAVRVSPPGGLVDIVLEDAGEGLVRVAIDDEGPGVPPAFRTRIFGRFERAGDDQGPGTGLGLAISREIIGQHGGTIGFEDRQPRGTRFAFTLPLADRAAPPGALPRLLLCESKPDVAARLKQLAESEGYHVTVAAAADQAEAEIARDGYAAVLVDLDFSAAHCLPFARAIRSLTEGGGPPIIVLAPGADPDLKRLVHFDFVDWLDSPLDQARLAAAMRVARERAGGGAPTVLHLDDDRDTLEITARMLGDQVRLLPATDVAQARAILERDAPDIAILDLQLENGSGLDLLPSLVDADGKAIPTIIYSAQQVSADAAQMVDAVLVKTPGSLPNLKTTIRRIAEERKNKASA